MVWFNGQFYASFNVSAFTKSPGTGCCAGVDGVDKLATLLMRGGLSE